MAIHDGLGNCEVMHRGGAKSEKPKARSVREILEEMINKLPDRERSRSGILDPKRYLIEVLSGVNTLACASREQETFIKNNVYQLNTADDYSEQTKQILLHVLLLNSFRG